MICVQLNVLVGYSSTQKGCKCFCLPSSWFYVTKDVSFRKQLFYFIDQSHENMSATEVSYNKSSPFFLFTLSPRFGQIYVQCKSKPQETENSPIDTPPDLLDHSSYKSTLDEDSSHQCTPSII